MKQRIFGLDLMRAVAILLVLMAHSYEYVLPGLDIDLHKLFGFLGVEVFFVLSGFLIGRILIDLVDNNEGLTWPHLRRFWIRRWFRTLPNYYLSLLIYLLFFFFTGIPENMEAGKTLSYVIFMQNSVSPHPGFFAIAWSLSIEEWFYLLFPILIIFIGALNRSKRSSVVWSLMIFLFLSVAIRAYLSYNFDLSWGPWFRKMIFWRMDSIMVGVLFAYLAIYRSRYLFDRKKIWSVLGMILSFLVLVPFWNEYVLLGKSTHFIDIWLFPLLSLGIALVLPLLSEWKVQEGSVARTITWISKISYSLYLIHWIVVLTLENFLPHLNNMLTFILIWILSIGLASAQFKYFELPTMRLRERYS